MTPADARAADESVARRGGNLINASGFGGVTAVSPARQVQLMARFHF